MKQGFPVPSEGKVTTGRQARLRTDRTPSRRSRERPLGQGSVTNEPPASRCVTSQRRLASVARTVHVPETLGTMRPSARLTRVLARATLSGSKSCRWWKSKRRKEGGAWQWYGMVAMASRHVGKSHYVPGQCTPPGSPIHPRSSWQALIWFAIATACQRWAKEKIGTVAESLPNPAAVKSSPLPRPRGAEGGRVEALRLGTCSRQTPKWAAPGGAAASEKQISTRFLDSR